MRCRDASDHLIKVPSVTMPGSPASSEVNGHVAGHAHFTPVRGAVRAYPGQMENKARTCLIGERVYPDGKLLLCCLPPPMLHLLLTSCCPLSPFSLAVSQLSMRAPTLFPFAVTLTLLSSSPAEPPFSPVCGVKS